MHNRRVPKENGALIQVDKQRVSQGFQDMKKKFVVRIFGIRRHPAIDFVELF